MSKISITVLNKITKLGYDVISFNQGYYKNSGDYRISTIEISYDDKLYNTLTSMISDNKIYSKTVFIKFIKELNIILVSMNKLYVDEKSEESKELAYSRSKIDFFNLLSETMDYVNLV